MKLKRVWWIRNEFLIIHTSGEVIEKLKITVLEEIFWHLYFSRVHEIFLKIWNSHKNVENIL